MTRISIGKIVDKLLFFHNRAYTRPDIRRKWSWALYETWKWCDEVEEGEKNDAE